MLLKKNIKLGKIKFNLIILVIFLLFQISPTTFSSDDLEGNHTAIKVLDKISSKNTLVRLKKW